MPPPKYVSKFNVLWMQDEELKSWLQSDPKISYIAQCSICKVDIHLKSIRLTAVKNASQKRKTPNFAFCGTWESKINNKQLLPYN